MVKPAIGRIEPLGLTRNGSFYYGVGRGSNNVYVVKMDSATGDVLAPPEKLVKQFEGSNHGPQYSPDGKYLAYVSQRAKTGISAGTGWGDTLCIRLLETGEEQEHQRALARLGVRGFSRPRWSPDSASLLLYGLDIKGRYGIYRINLETGRAASILSSEQDMDVGPAEGWRDGNSFFYAREMRKSGQGEVCVRDLDSRNEKVLYSILAKTMGAQAVSPDRRWLSTLDRPGSGKILSVISTDSGAVRQIFKFSQKDNPATIRHAWSADGKYVFYTRRVALQDSFKFEVWRVPIDGGQPQKTGLEMPGAIDHINAHPDGVRLAFENMASGAVSPAEVWVLENFLPKIK
jgi:Tol biopolymer transport system component